MYVCVRVALRAGCPRLSSLHPNPPREISDPNLSNAPGPIQTAHGQVWPWDSGRKKRPGPGRRARVRFPRCAHVRVRQPRRDRGGVPAPRFCRRTLPKKKPHRSCQLSSAGARHRTAPHTTPTPTRPREAALEWSGADGYRTRHAGSRRPGART